MRIFLSKLGLLILLLLSLRALTIAQTRAIIVGDEGFYSDAILNGPFYDVKKIKQLFKPVKDYSKVLLNTDGITLTEACKNMFLKANEDHTIFFYFTGHGCSGDLLIESGLFDFEKVQRLMVKSKAKRKIVVLDCCDTSKVKKHKGITYFLPTKDDTGDMTYVSSGRLVSGGVFTSTILTKLKNLFK